MCKEKTFAFRTHVENGQGFFSFLSSFSANEKEMTSVISDSKNFCFLLGTTHYKHLAH
jgi:hypothetical protein